MDFPGYIKYMEYPNPLWGFIRLDASTDTGNSQLTIYKGTYTSLVVNEMTLLP